MTLRYLLDIDVLSEPLYSEPDHRVLQRLRDHRDEVATSSVVWHELLFGCYRLPTSARRAAIVQYLDEVVSPSVPILPYDGRTARWRAAERARLTGVGRTPPFADGQIAATAWANDLAWSRPTLPTTPPSGKSGSRTGALGKTRASAGSLTPARFYAL